MSETKRNLIDLAALSDPTDAHSLEELRAHLEDGGDMEPEVDFIDFEHDYTDAERESVNKLITGLRLQEQASERSGGDGA